MKTVDEGGKLAMGFINRTTIDRHRLSPIDKLKIHNAPVPVSVFAVGAQILA